MFKETCSIINNLQLNVFILNLYIVVDKYFIKNVILLIQ